MEETPETQADEWVGRVLDDRYRLVRVLGAGGLGTVYLAKHLRLDRSVAIKMLHPELLPNADLRLRFDREVKTLSRLSHPHIVSLTDSGVLEDGRGYLVMELLEGESLEERLGPGPLSPREAIEIARQMLLGLSEAHDKGVLHRDLKPANVFLLPLAEGIHVKLLDFGLAKVRSELASDPGLYPTLTATGMIVGTPTYMSPEQATGQAVTGAADAYAIGIVLYEMLTGRPPFRHENKLETIRAHLSQPVPALDVTAPELRPTAELRAFVARALEKDPSRRFDDARAMLRALDTLPRPAATRQGARPPAPTRPAGAEATMALLSGELERADVPATSDAAGATVLDAPLFPSGTPPRPPAPRAAPTPSRLPIVAIVVVTGLGLATVSWLALGGSEPTPRVADVPTPPPPEAPTPAEPPPADEGGAGNPFARGELPDALRSARREILRGRRLSAAQVRDVEAYRGAHPSDPRAPLLLARNERFGQHWVAMVPHYVAAHAADPSAADFAPMLADLVRAAGDEAASERASDAVIAIYGARALAAVEARLAELAPGPEATRLLSLRARVDLE